jgi:RimJ/RimL family protein N-acetyltransferase
LLLRLWRDEDFAELARLNADRLFNRYLRARKPIDSAEQFARFRQHWAERGYGLWAVEERATGTFVGRIGLSHHRLWPEDVEIGWALDPAVWGRGYATEGGAAALAHAFTRLGVDRVVSIVHPQNAASIAVMDRLGIGPWRTVAWPEGGIDLEVRAIERAEWTRLQSPA